MTRRKWMWIGLAVAVVAVANLGYQLSSHDAPAGQPRLVTLDAATLPQLRADFNRAAAETRIVVLLAPT